MSNGKYIIIDGHLDTTVILLTHCEQHASVARRLGGTVHSAGFFSILDGKFHCFGKSTSLRIPSRPEEDSEFLNRHFKMGD